jgi:hypothetical protein
VASGRIYTPRLLSMAGSGCGRFYVLTGPEYGEEVQRQVVEVDLVMAGKALAVYDNENEVRKLTFLAGHLGAPKSLAGATVTRTAHTAAGQRTYNVLSIPQLFRAKLHALDQREAERDLGDLEWLCLNYNSEIQEAADTTDENERIGFLNKYKERYSGKGEVVVKALMTTLKL